MQHITTLPELGAEVARLRRQHGLTQAQLGALAGIGQSTLARFETGGVAEFGSRKLLRLLDTLGYGVQFVATATSSRWTTHSVNGSRRRLREAHRIRQ